MNRVKPTMRIMVALVVTAIMATTVHADGASVFMYHRFGEGGYPATNVRIADFEAQLDWIGNNGFEVVDLRRLLEVLDGDGKLPERAVVLTFDDAYASIHDRAWPLLRARGWPVTVFVATDPVDEGFRDYLDWTRMRELARAGVRFANHGAGHQHLATPLDGETDAERRARVRADLLKGAERLEAELGATGAVIDDVFAYPYGEYDTVVAGVIRELGWRAFGQQSGPVGRASDPLALPRFPINERYSDLAEFATKARSRPLPIAEVDPWDPVTGPNARLELRLASPLARPDSLVCYVSGQDRATVTWIDAGRHLRVQPEAPLALGRQRVNCTAPGPEGRYFWFSHPWIVVAGRD